MSFSPAQPCVRRDARFSQAHPPDPRQPFPPTRPTDCEQSISQRRALCPGEHRLIYAPSKLARSVLQEQPGAVKRVGVSMVLPSWLVSPLDGVVAMLVLLRPWTSTAHINGPSKLARTLSGAGLV